MKYFVTTYVIGWERVMKDGKDLEFSKEVLTTICDESSNMLQLLFMTFQRSYMCWYVKSSGAKEAAAGLDKCFGKETK